MENHSFRDPGGRLYRTKNGRILRVVNENGLYDFEAFMASSVAKNNAVNKQIISSTVLIDWSGLEGDIDLTKCSVVVEHERVAFPSFPYEWSPCMLYEAGRLTLDLANSLLPEGLGLKDATPYNILFRGPHPILVDVLSVERRTSCDATWLAYSQFMRMFVLPLLLNKYFRWPLADVFLTRRDGVEPQDVYMVCSWLQRIWSPFLTAVSLPVWLMKQRQNEVGIYQKKLLGSAEKASFILASQFKSLHRTLDTVTPEVRQSHWTEYMQGNNNYSAEQSAQKARFVEAVLTEVAPPKVLDVGCNTGYFSMLAARSGASVVAVDYDPAVIDRVWRQACKEKYDILPLVVNLTRPSPAMGWRNAEYSSFIERAKEHFDMVFMLAVIHHMMVTEGIPLPEIIELANDLTNRYLIVEYIDPRDSMFKILTRGREVLYDHITIEYFEDCCQRHFVIRKSYHLQGTERTLYLMEKR